MKAWTRGGEFEGGVGAREVERGVGGAVMTTKSG